MKHLHAILPLLALSSPALTCAVALSSQASEGANFSERGTVWSPSVAVVYGFDCTNLETDISGVSFKYAVYGEDRYNTTTGARIIPEAFINTTVGCGWNNDCDGIADISGDLELYLVTHCFGVAMRAKFADTLSMFVRGEFGACAVYGKFSPNEQLKKEKDSTFGLMLNIHWRRDAS